MEFLTTAPAKAWGFLQEKLVGKAKAWARDHLPVTRRRMREALESRDRANVGQGDWRTRYRLVGQKGVFVYALKDEHRSDEPFHYLCPSCFGQEKKGILQRATKTERTTRGPIVLKEEVKEGLVCAICEYFMQTAETRDTSAE